MDSDAPLGSGAGVAPVLVLPDDDLLHFDNLHVDLGPELLEVITDTHWLAADGIEVSVQLPIELSSDLFTDLPALHDGAVFGGDWLL